MKVICAGAPNTGTKSMTHALRTLGYGPVYDAPEALEFGLKEWEDVWERRQPDLNVLFNKVYAKVEAVVDFPHSYFFDEFLERWPNSKVVLTLRAEEAWYQGFKKMTDRGAKNYGKFVWIRYLSPSLNRMLTFYEHMLTGIIGFMVPHEFLWKRWYRRHNAYVRSVVLNDQLLEYRISEGWEPLCKFLGKPVPDKPFPHDNKASAKHNIADKMMQDTWLAQKAKKEITIVLIAFPILLALFLAYLYYF